MSMTGDGSEAESETGGVGTSMFSGHFPSHSIFFFKSGFLSIYFCSMFKNSCPFLFSDSLQGK